MTRIKICGITNLADARLAAELGADALGFIFHRQSPRCVTVEQAADICRELPPFVLRVGVFVNAPLDEVRLATSVCGLDAAQFHGEETPEYCRQFSARRIKAIRARDRAAVLAAAEYDVDALLLDTYTASQRGGTGQTFDWSLAVEAKKFGRPVILSGGLTPENVVDAIRQAQPYAVDVASGVEREPGQKDPEKLRRFIEIVKTT